MVQTIKKTFSDFYNFIRSLDRLFWILTVIFAVIPALYFSYVPLWDGWEFLGCYVDSALTGSYWCFDHSAFAHMFIFSLIQRIDLGNTKLIYTANILIGIAGILSMRALLTHLFGERLSPINLTLLTFSFGLSPIYIVHAIQPSLDYTLPIFLVMLLLFLFQKRLILAAAVGILMVFTKESGFMLYGASVFLYLTLGVIKDPNQLKDKRRLLGEICILMVPIVLFIIYMLLVPATQIGDSWIDGIITMFRFYLLDKVILAQLISVLVINFAWIMSVFILIGISSQLVGYLGGRKNNNRLNTGFKSRYDQLYFYILFVAVIYFLTRIPFVNNPRYMLPVLPLLIIIFAASLLSVVRKQYLITGILAILLILLTLSSFRTVDPVSKAAMGTFRFGSHKILQMTSYDQPFHAYGKDQLVYNFEFTNLHYITEKIFKEYGWQKVYAAAPGTAWGSNLNTFDTAAGRRAIFGKDVKTISFIYSNLIWEGAARPREIYYISYPNYDRFGINERERARISRIYDLTDKRTFDNGGYSIDVYNFVLKDN